jgi:hypothetical protein
MEAMTTVPCPGGDAKPGTIANVWQVGRPSCKPGCGSAAAVVVTCCCWRLTETTCLLSCCPLLAVLLLLQSGYKIHDRILRAAKVIVYQE